MFLKKYFFPTAIFFVAFTALYLTSSNSAFMRELSNSELAIILIIAVGATSISIIAITHFLLSDLKVIKVAPSKSQKKPMATPKISTNNQLQVKQ